MRLLDESPLPVVLTGDLNSAADGSSTDTYKHFLDEGFSDVGSVAESGAGYTSNHAPDLSNEQSGLYHRIDFIMVRERSPQPGGVLSGSGRAELVGEDPSDRTPGGLWPSDHAGLLAWFTTSFPPAPG